MSRVGWSRLGSERGQALAEWALLTVLIAIVALVAVANAGTEVSSMYSEIGDGVEAANSN